MKYISSEQSGMKVSRYARKVTGLLARQLRTASVGGRAMLCLALATCCITVAVACGAALSAVAAPAVADSVTYTPPGPVTTRGKAPGMQVWLVSGADGGPRTYVLAFGKGDQVASGLTEWAERERITGAQLSAIGSFSSAHLGWLDKARKAYRDIRVNQQVECISLQGNIALVDGKPAVHVHSSVGFPDGTMKSGHLIEAVVWPTLEVFVAVTPQAIEKREDSETGLNLLSLDAGLKRRGGR